MKAKWMLLAALGAAGVCALTVPVALGGAIGSTGAKCIKVPSHDGSLAKVQQSGVLRVGAVDGLLPYSSSSSSQPGFELEMAKYVAAQLCVKLKPIFVSWAGLIPGLQAKRYDVIFDGMFITPDRLKAINFSKPYYASGETIVVKKGNPEGIHMLNDLAGKTVGVLTGSVTVDILKKAGVTDLKYYDDQNQILLELGNGRLDAGYLEAPSSAWVIHKQPTLQVELVKSYVPAQRYNAGVGILKSNNDLRAGINQAITQLASTKTRDRIFAKYGVPYYKPTSTK
jgi:ABC-type amino acid transport substrate-binding protein